MISSDWATFMFHHTEGFISKAYKQFPLKPEKINDNLFYWFISITYVATVHNSMVKTSLLWQYILTRAKLISIFTSKDHFGNGIWIASWKD